MINSLQMTGWKPVMLAILLEKFDEESFWRPYFDFLPASFDLLPSVWSSEERKFLQGSCILEKIEGIKEDYETNFKEILEKCFPNYPLPESLFHFAGCLVSSYSFVDETDDEEENLEIMMIPLADLFNHKTGYNNVRILSNF